MSEKINGYDYDWANSENMVLCGASSYVQKYYFNEKFNLFPEEIKNELKIMCVSFAEEAGGILTLEFDNSGDLKFCVRVDDGDFYFDEIESGLKISSYQRKKEELLSQLELFYRMIILGEHVE
ncbi:hypothetical protein J4O15_04520 [Lachnoanaerobaculum sp. Marseille-Q4761]|jgi:hypothetical protein|uniref:DUF6145 family protein n=1 Tax=Lachnoanaerobaculum sp. Marseille-Q4761 TaxID=2819511 RepID=UPI001AA0BFC7|nr:DUF6145 family protein [Lachnoanaerobaculum sp. Marseille-Q4761]MBO1870223.1 hypothetical protein [Lachnoanaerobaculum sp. Marseille-Q4761]